MMHNSWGSEYENRLSLGLKAEIDVRFLHEDSLVLIVQRIIF